MGTKTHGLTYWKKRCTNRGGKLFRKKGKKKIQLWSHLYSGKYGLPTGTLVLPQRP